MVIAWLVATLGVLIPLFSFGLVTALLWQVVVSLLVGGLLLGVTVALVPREPATEPRADDGPPRLVVRHLRKVYGLAGPVRRALRAGTDFRSQVRDLGGAGAVSDEMRDAVLPLVVLVSGAALVALRFQSVFWQLVAWLVFGALAARLVATVGRARGRVDDRGELLPGWERRAAGLLPWIAFGIFAWREWLSPKLRDLEPSAGWFPLLLVGVLLGIFQAGRRTARALSSGEIDVRPRRRPWRRTRSLWRRFSRRSFGLDLPSQAVTALAATSFEVERGMVGVLGPNGAGKTTLLRQLAGILESTRGTIRFGGVRLEVIRKHLARTVGYLPQDAGMPPGLSAREYLQYFAALYQLPGDVRAARIESLLSEVGLAERAGEKIGGYSGGMRQRVAVARTLLRLPPIIVVDEPTVGLDPRERVRFRNLLSRLAKERVVMFSTHVVEDVAVACERVLVLCRGRLVFDGEPRALASVAEGKVWALRTEPGEEPSLPEEAIVADQIPEQDGAQRLRVLAGSAPDPRSEPIEPSLEDGYLWLVGGAPA